MTVYDVDIEMTVFEYMLHKYIQKKYIKSINDIFFGFHIKYLYAYTKYQSFLKERSDQNHRFFFPQPVLSCLSLSCCLGGDGEMTGKECWLGKDIAPYMCSLTNTPSFSFFHPPPRQPHKDRHAASPWCSTSLGLR